MGGMFYSLKEVVEKLKKTEDEISALVKSGRLREFRDGPNVLFKIDEVGALLSDTTFMAAQKPDGETEEEVSLILEEEPEKTKGKSSDTTAASGEGVNVLGEADAGLDLAEDTLAETKAGGGATSIIDGALSSRAGSGEASLEEIEENVNLDTFGSGSGLLDLSLQADDTSLGGILDEIYTPEGEEAKEEMKEGSVVELAAEADQLAEQQPVPAEPGMEVAAAAEAVVCAAEPAVDSSSSMLGIMLFVPILATIYAIVVALIGQKNISSSILGLKGLIWPIVLGGWVVTGLLAGAALMAGKPKKAKAPKVKKEKKSKKKKGKEEPAAEAAQSADEQAAPEAPAAEEATAMDFSQPAEGGTGEAAPDLDLDLGLSDGDDKFE